MKVLLVANYLPDSQESMLRFAEMLSSGLQQLGVEVKVWHPPVFFGGLKATVGVKKWFGYLDKYFVGYFSLKKFANNVDIVHVLDHSNAMYGPWIGSKPWLITCHDLLAVRSAKGEFFGQEVAKMGRILQSWIESSLHKAPIIAAVSQATAEDLHRLKICGSSKMTVIWNGMNACFNRLPAVKVRERLEQVFKNRDLVLPDSFVFHIGGNQWYKNREGTLDIFGELIRLTSNKEIKLVMGGKPPTEEVLRKAEALSIKDSVIWLNNLSTEELELCYNGAECLLFPSLAEGFGWPIVEALATGCAVTTSNRAPMTEIGGADTLFIDPENSKQAAYDIKVWLDASNRKCDELINDRCIHSLKFSTEAMLKRYLSIYKKLLEN